MPSILNQDDYIKLDKIAVSQKLFFKMAASWYRGIKAEKLAEIESVTLVSSDFGIDKYVPKVGDEVKIVIQVEATKH